MHGECEPLLKRLYGGSILIGWHARRGQIYPELARLDHAGMVEHTLVEQHDRPDKKVYTITEAGRNALARWAAEPMSIQPDRDQLMLKVYSLWLAEPVGALTLIQRYAGEHADRLARYEAIRDEMERESPDDLRRFDSPRFAAYATLRRGIEYERGFLSWCEWMVGILESHLPD